MNFLTKKQAVKNLLIYYVGYLFVFPILLALFLSIMDSHHFSINLGIAELIIYGTVSGFVLYTNWSLLKTDWIALKGKTKNMLKEVGKHMLLMYMLNIICNVIIINLTGSVQSNNQSEIVALVESRFTITVFLTLFFAPLVEEMVFRCSIYSLFYKKNKVLTVVLASLAFGLIHVMGSIFAQDWNDLLHLLTYASMGFCLSKCYGKTKNIFGPILLHFFNNLIGLLMILLLG